MTSSPAAFPAGILNPSDAGPQNAIASARELSLQHEHGLGQRSLRSSTRRPIGCPEDRARRSGAGTVNIAARGYWPSCCSATTRIRDKIENEKSIEV
jgi:hypothetical protein